MGLADTVTKAYMKENTVFADAFNYLIYGGKTVVNPTQLKELDTTEIALPFGAQNENRTQPDDAVQKYRDVLKSAIIKQDDETKKPVLVANTEFKIYNLDEGKYVEQTTTYPSTVTHKSYFTDENGYLILPSALKCGNYRIEEVTAPDGYTQNTNFVFNLNHYHRLIL